MNYLYVCILAIFSFNCGATSLVVKPSFTNENSTYAFFGEQISLTQAKDFLSLETKRWSYEFGLESSEGKYEEVETCEALTKKIKNGYQAFIYSEQKVVNARKLTCETWRIMSKLTSSDVSYLRDFEHNLNLPKKMPRELSLIISKDDERNLAKANSWEEMGHFKKLEVLNKDQAIYYDNSGGIQSLTVMAKGDYNNDGIEDMVLYMFNGVEGGSYTSTHGYVVTRLAADAPYTLIKQF
jgi:hypothetical protein